MSKTRRNFINFDREEKHRNGNKVHVYRGRTVCLSKADLKREKELKEKAGIA